VCVRCVFVFLVTALYCFSMDILSEINFMMMMMMLISSPYLVCDTANNWAGLNDRLSAIMEQIHLASEWMTG